MNQLRSYQEIGINSLAQKASKGLKRIIFQLATGGGKTVAFAGLCNRFLNKQQKRVLILVHREELLQQAYKTIFNWYDIVAFPVTSSNSYLANSLVYIAMVETAYNRLKKNRYYFGNIGLVIVDECHLGNFKKLYEYFPESLIIGFTATPLSSSKKDPLKNHFQDIVACVDIPELIGFWKQDHNTGLVPNRTFNVENINRKQLKLSSTGEFDERLMGEVFSGTKHVQNCVDAYKKIADHTKAIVFNCTVEHSLKVNAAFLAAGYPSRHVDGETPERERKQIFEWFRKTPGAVLNNVGIATTGFDEKTIQTVIANKSTMSLNLWLQMTGRGSRPNGDEKLFFNIIDLGGNAYAHGDWSDPRNWAEMFHNPDKAKAVGEAPLKSCKGCGVLIHLSIKICKHCGADNSKTVVYDAAPVSISDLSKRNPPFIDIPYLIQDFASKTTADGKSYKEMAVLHEIKRIIISHAKRSWKIKRMDENMAAYLNTLYQHKVQEWCVLKLKNYDWWIQKASKEWMFYEIKRVWKWEPVPMKQTA